MEPLRVSTGPGSIEMRPHPDEETLAVIQGAGITGIQNITERGLNGEGLDFNFGRIEQREIEKRAQMLVEKLGGAGCEAVFVQEPEQLSLPPQQRVHWAGKILRRVAIAR